MLTYDSVFYVQILTFWYTQFFNNILKSQIIFKNDLSVFLFNIFLTVVFMKGMRDITMNQRVCKMTSDDYVKFTLKRSVVSDAGTYCILARNMYGCDRAFVTVVVSTYF